MYQSITCQNASFQGQSGRMPCSPSQIGKTTLSKNAGGVMKRTTAAAFLPLDAHDSVAVLARSLPSDVWWASRHQEPEHENSKCFASSRCCCVRYLYQFWCLSEDRERVHRGMAS